MHHAKHLNWLLFCFALAVSGVAQAAENTPDALVKSTADEVLAILKKDADIKSGDQQKAIQLIDAKVLPHFDFTNMTQLAVGKNWARATPAQKQQLTNEFRQLLVRTYSSALTEYRNQTIEYKPSNTAPGATDTTVKTLVNQAGGQPLEIDYSMHKVGNAWKVYDIVVDNVSLVTNYRNSFSTTVRQSGIDGLIKMLSERNQRELGSKG